MQFTYSRLYLLNSEQNYKYIQSKNGKYLLIYEGYAYRKYMKSKANQSYWTCTLRGCRAKATMTSDGWFGLSKYSHNHEPNHEEMRRKELISELRKLTLETDLSPAELLQQVGITEDPDKKFRDTINFWRWRAKRKSEAESAGYMEDFKKAADDDDDYKFVKTHHSHFLQFRNYLYRKYMSSKVDTGSYWRCRREDCPARAKLSATGELSCTNFNHNHPPEEEEGEDTQEDIKQLARETALKTEIPISEILKMYQSEDDVDLKKYLKNIRCRKLRNMREKKKKFEDGDPSAMLISQIEMLENVPPGVFVRIPKDLLSEIPGLSQTDEGTDYLQGTVVKMGDQVSVQLTNSISPKPDEVKEENYFPDSEEDDIQQQIEYDSTELKYEDLSECVTYVIQEEKDAMKNDLNLQDEFQMKDPLIYQILTEK